MMVEVKLEELAWKGRLLNTMNYEELQLAFKEFQQDVENGVITNPEDLLTAFNAEFACLRLEKRVILVDNFKECAPLSRPKVVKIAQFSNAIIEGIFQTQTKHKFKILC